MIHHLIALLRRQSILVIWCLAAGLLATPAARAGLSVQMNVSLFNANGTNYYYIIGASLSENGLSPNSPYGSYFIAAPGFPTNYGTSGNYYYDPTNGFNFNNSESGFYNDFGSMMQGLTNGPWTILVTNLNTTNVSIYHFTVSAPTLTIDTLPPVFVTFPTNESVGVTNQLTFSWVGGPANFDALKVKVHNEGDNSGNYDQSASLPTTQNNWQPSMPLPAGPSDFQANYTREADAILVVSTPLDSSSNSISEWDSTVQLSTSFDSQFTIPAPAGSGHALVAHYTWDASFPDALSASLDSSSNGLNLSYSADSGAQGGVTLTNDAIEGGQAVVFHDGDGSSYGVLSYSNSPTLLLNTLAGSFSISCWIKTAQNISGNGAPAYQGAGIVAADLPNQYNDTIPIALTGNQITFATGGQNFDDNLNSSATVNDGQYHHVVVTRDQPTGGKCIYIDGVLDSSGPGTTNFLNDPQSVAFGALSDAGISDPDNFSFYNGFDGEMDDLQIYSGVLAAADVAYLFNNPGVPVPSGYGNGPVAHYSFDNSLNLGADTSGNGYDLDFNGNFDGNGVTISSNAAAGPGAAYFDGGSFLSYNSTPRPVLAAFASDFTLALWIETTDTSGNDNDPAYFDAGIVAADLPGLFNDLIPMALTGGQIGFNTGGDSDSTLNSTIDINNGSYHHAVVTRNQATGEKQIYIDGVFNTSGFATQNLLNDPKIFGFGAEIDASTSDPNNTNPNNYFQGWLDDIQLYSRVLSSNEIAFLYTNPGSTIVLSNGGGSPIQITNVSVTGGNIQFSFLTTSGRANLVEASTNLASGAWDPLTNFIGDGSLRQFSFPATNAPTQFFRVHTP